MNRLIAFIGMMLMLAGCEYHINFSGEGGFDNIFEEA